jgi:acyl carrier protein
LSLDSSLRSIFAAVFGVKASALTDADSPLTIEGWDSVNHIQLILALESEFGIQFDPDEIAELNSFGIIRERLEALKY